MKIVGLVTEYNPFHNGHKYHIEEAKRITGAEYAIAVMSGNFVQRGTPAIIDKYTRAEMALRNGIDLVLELPVCYATGSAEFFARGAVSLLDKLGIIDTLCFGSEYGDIHMLKEAAAFLTKAPASFDERIQELLKEGLTYPAARSSALQQSLEKENIADGQALSGVLSEPNNILGIEYMKALIHLDSAIIPAAIKRKSAHYHDSNLAGTIQNNENPSLLYSDEYLHDIDESMTISSATAIRKAIDSKMDNTSDYFEEMRHSVPGNVYDLLVKHYRKTYPVTEEDFAQIIKYKLLAEDQQTLTGYMDISKNLADRMKNSDYNSSIFELAQNIKTKNLTLTRINRAIIHLLLNIRKDTVNEYSNHGYAQYARVLGIKKESTHLIRSIETYGRIPIIQKVSKAEEQLDSIGKRMLSEDIFAAHLYNQAVFEKYDASIPNEYKHGICVV
ncbi:MAG TPA: nucleotidyltransferase family protein [Mobilitalea sp.]|nr:nucleotidyltransferase family protein [Mobilitalea sp.]